MAFCREAARSWLTAEVWSGKKSEPETGRLGRYSPGL